MRLTIFGLVLLFTGFMLFAGGGVEENELNIYTHRHYDTDRQLFSQFEQERGVTINVVKAGADELIERLRQEGELSPADILITVDAGRLVRARKLNLLQPVESDTLRSQVPAHLRDPEGYWYGVTKRARVIAYSKSRVDPSQIERYEDLASSRWEGSLTIRSSTNIYNQSLLASLVSHLGSEEARAWAEGVVSNFARQPKGNDRDQVKAIAAGVADLAVVNTYYIGLLRNSDDALEREAGNSVGLIFPNQGDRGTHVNVSGAGVTASSTKKELAVDFLEFLTSKEVQETFASANYEYPVNAEARITGTVAEWGSFREDDLSLTALGELNEIAVSTFEAAGWN